jgi:hypothetical protein
LEITTSEALQVVVFTGILVCSATFTVPLVVVANPPPPRRSFPDGQLTSPDAVTPREAFVAVRTAVPVTT